MNRGVMPKITEIQPEGIRNAAQYTPPSAMNMLAPLMA